MTNHTILIEHKEKRELSTKMTRPTEAWDRGRILNGVLYCASCAVPMLKIGANYLCPTGVAQTETPCPTKSINAQELLQVAVAHIIDRVLNPQTLEQVSSIIQDEYGAKARRSQEDLARAEAAIAAMNALKNQAVHNVEHNDRPYSEVAGEIEQLNQNTIALSHEARTSRREIDAYNFVTDQDRIAASAVDPETYLGQASTEDTRELFEMFVRSIEVGRDCVTIHFTDNVPDTGQPDRRLMERIPLR